MRRSFKKMEYLKSRSGPGTPAEMGRYSVAANNDQPKKKSPYKMLSSHNPANQIINEFLNEAKLRKIASRCKSREEFSA